jgi:peptide/nickel transport system permease protein
MLTTILRRIAQLAVLSLLVTSATFLISAVIPGDFFSVQESDPGVRRETLERKRRDYGLDRPLAVQYVQWLRRCSQLDLGQSLFYGRPVREVVLDSLSKTLWLGIPALLLGMVGGVLIGAAHGASRHGAATLALDLLTTAALALPTVVLGLAALFLAVRTNWFPLGGMDSLRLEDHGPLAHLFDRLHHLVLPVACLAVPIFAYVERIQCAATRDVAGEPFLRAARARGLPPGRVFLRHLLLPALNPVISTSGPLLAGVLSGSLVLEVLFSWPGLGQVTYDALFHRDHLLVVGCVVGSTILLLAGNLAADLLLLALDPRTGRRREIP